MDAQETEVKYKQLNQLPEFVWSRWVMGWLVIDNSVYTYMFVLAEMVECSLITFTLCIYVVCVLGGRGWGQVY